jgi:ribosome maturation factor RimP
MKASAQEQKISQLLAPVIEDLGYALIQVRLIGSAKLQTLQIMAEDPKTETLDLNACTEISRAISAVLDVEDPIVSSYQLEVSSPGIDRPLTSLSDFEKYKGFELSLETQTPLEGQKRFKGQLIKLENDHVYVLQNDPKETVEIPFDLIAKAKLVLTDELLKKGKTS